MLTWRAHAKINLALAVGPPAPPRNYHPIASWFACVTLHDEVTIERARDGAPSSWRVEWAADAPRPTPIDWPVEKDLAARAHRALEAAAGRELPVRAVVRKRVPVGAGMGGGSADCAAAMMAVDALFGLGLGAARLRELSAPLGSDVAFFIDDERGPERPPRPALVTGFGERVERLPRTAGAHAALLFPPFGCPTGAVYAAFDRAGPGPLRERDVRALAATGRADAPELFNDLEPAACAAEPRLADALARLRPAAAALGARVHVTGSGSAMFAPAHSAAHAAEICAAAASAAPDIVALPTMIV